MYVGWTRIGGGTISVDSSEPITCAEWLDLARAADARGDFLAAIDNADQGLEAYPDEIELHYIAALAAARADATGEARRRLVKFRERALRAIAEDRIVRGLGEKVEALAARILKDEAYLSGADDRARKLRLAAEEYERVFRKYGSLYTCVNAASLFSLAGVPKKAEALVESAFSLGAKLLESNTGLTDNYYFNASMAEASLVSGETDKTKQYLLAASRASDAEVASRATTVRQFRRLLKNMPVDANEVLKDVANRTVIHFCGHMIGDGGSRFPAALADDVRERIDTLLERFDVGHGVGSLACGADILFAEALIDRGADLTIVLPFEREKFIETSVERGGAKWVERFRACLKAAGDRVHYATESGYLGDDQLFRYGAQLAMGLAVLTAERLETDVRQILVWDEQRLGAIGGTEESYDHWLRFNRPSELIDLPSVKNAKPGTIDGEVPEVARHARAMLFGDIKGFSKLQDSQLPLFVKKIMGTVATVLSEEVGEKDLTFSNTWGDGIFLVFEDTVVAAKLALKLQKTLAELDVVGLPDGLELRLGAHVGPTFELEDPVLGKGNFYGAHITRAARLEPVARGGTVYTTEAFAAAIALESGDEIWCEYIGNLAGAKDFGALPVYVLCE